jgi:hypothetical protein
MGHHPRVAEDVEHPINDPIRRLIDEWCDRRELGALATVLPAFISNNGLTDGWADLMEALRTMRAAHSLPFEEQETIERLVPLLEKAVYRL